MARTIESDANPTTELLSDRAPRGRYLRRLVRRVIPPKVMKLIHRTRAYRGLWQDYERTTGHALSCFSVIRQFIRWNSSLSPGRSPICDRAPWVVYDAQRYLDRRLSSAHRIFEYGAGGSTVFFLDRRCEVVTVEHDATWLENVRAAITNDARWTCHLVPPAEIVVRESHTPRFCSRFPGYEHGSFEAYIRSLEKYPNDYFDVIFVDGRARSDALAIAPSKVKPGGIIVLDNSERDRYQKAVLMLEALGWTKIRFAGPGPYVRTEFWDTCVFLHPASKKDRA